MAATLVLVAIAAVAVGLAFSVRIHSTPDYREGLVALHRPLSLNPLVGRDDPAVHDVGHLLYRGLLRLDDQAAPAPDLASSYSVTPDGLVYTLTLPETLRWSDGSPLTVADVAATVAFVQDPRLADPALAAIWSGVRMVINPPGGIQLTLPAPRASFAASLTELPILPLGQLDPAAQLSLRDHSARPLATSGPYRVQSSDAGGLRLESNREAAARPHLERLELRLYPDFAGAERALAGGEVDALLGGTPGEISELAGLDRHGLHRLATFRFVDLLFNEATPGLAEPAVRQAIATAIDRDRLVAEALGGAGIPQAHAIPAGLRWIAGPPPAPPDPARARAQLDAAGWTLQPDGVRGRGAARLFFGLAVADSAPLPSVARAVAAQLSSLGIATAVQIIPAAGYRSSVLEARGFNLALADWESGPDPDISSYWRSNAVPPRGFNLSGAAPDPFLDRALDTLATVSDQRARQDAARRVESLLGDSAPAVFLYTPVEALSVSDAMSDVSIPETGGGAARYDAITTWVHGQPPGPRRDLPTVLLIAAAAVLGVLAVGFTGVRLAGRFLPEDAASPLERACVALLLSVAEVVLVLQVLGALHLLWPLAVLVVHLVIAAAVVARVPPAERHPPPRRLPSAGWLAVIAVAVPFAVLVAVQSLAGPSGEHETRRHHVVNAAHWLSGHETWTLPFAAPGDATTATAPGNSDLLALWGMLPTHTDELAYLGNLVMALLVVLAAALVIREIGASAWKGGLAAVLVLTAPVCLLTQTRSLLPELTAVAGILLAIGMILRGRHLPASPLWAILAGLGLGLAAGSELAALLPAATVALWCVVVTPRHRIRTACLVAAGMVAMAGFWYLRNLVDTGNPLFPIPLTPGGQSLFGGGPDIHAAWSTPLLEHLLSLHLVALGQWAVAFWQLYGLGMVVLLVLVAPLAAGALVLRRPSLLLLAGLMPLLVLAYLATPGTGGGPGGDLRLIAGGLRYSLLPALLALMLCATALGTTAWLIAALDVLVYNACLAIQAPTRADLALAPEQWLLVAALTLVLICLALTAGTGLRTWARLSRGWAVAAAALGAVLATAGLAMLLRQTEASGPGPIRTALARAGRQEGLVVVVNDPDLRSVLGARLDTDIAAAGRGQQGEQTAIADGAALTRRIEEMAPAAVVVGSDGSDPPPAGWHPPQSWRLLPPTEGGVRVYLP